MTRIIRWELVPVFCISAVIMQCFAAGASAQAVTLPVLWTAGGLAAGNDSAGQAARMTTDSSGNIAIVSGPAFARDLGVTSYTPGGVLRWQRSVAPVAGTFDGSWIEAAPDGDVIAVGSNVGSSGSLFGVTIVRYASDGTLLWRNDSTGVVLSFGRLVVDSQGNAYLTINSTLTKYSPAGSVLWSTAISTFGSGAALSPDESRLILTGASGGNWRTQAFDTATGVSQWLVVAAEGTSANDVVVDNGRAYVAGQGYTGAGTPDLARFLTVVAYDQATGTRLWRTDKKPDDGIAAAGLWMSMTPDGHLVVTGQTSRGFLDWYTVGLTPDGAVRWEAVRDGGLMTDEIPRDVLVLADGTTLVTGTGGPALPGGFIQGVTVGYSPNGTLLWEAFSGLATTWAAPLPDGDVCATGGYDALITCFDVPGAVDPLDSDGDTVVDEIDNCTLMGNVDQRDTDGDGFGNACDADLNGDGIVNAVDLGLLRSVFFTSDANADFNGDGVVNTTDLGILRSTFFGAPGPSGVLS